LVNQGLFYYRFLLLEDSVLVLSHHQETIRVNYGLPGVCSHIPCVLRIRMLVTLILVDVNFLCVVSLEIRGKALLARVGGAGDWHAAKLHYATLLRNGLR
jgi:hypothetical protein